MHFYSLLYYVTKYKVVEISSTFISYNYKYISFESVLL